MAEGGAPQGVDSAMLASMDQGGSSGGAGGGLAAAGTEGMGSMVGAAHSVDGLGNLDAIKLGSVEDIGSFLGSGALSDNVTAFAEGNMAAGSINHNAFDANNLGFGDISAGKLGPGAQLNAEQVPAISSKGRAQGG